jgi:hypothetical protein
MEQLVFRSQTFDRRDFTVLAGYGERQARKHTPPIDENSAGAARAMIASLLGARMTQSLSQQIKERNPWFNANSLDSNVHRN